MVCPPFAPPWPLPWMIKALLHLLHPTLFLGVEQGGAEHSTVFAVELFAPPLLHLSETRWSTFHDDGSPYNVHSGDPSFIPPPWSRRPLATTSFMPCSHRNSSTSLMAFSGPLNGATATSAARKPV